MRSTFEMDTVIGRFRVDAVLGEGAMGTAYLAEARDTDDHGSHRFA
jgi:hypothetical protein